MDSFDVKIQQSTFELLTEVGDYLARLPAHPMTRAMYQKVQAHLNNPLTTAQSKRLKDLADAEAKAAMVKSGMSFWGTHCYTPSGAPLIKCQFLYPKLRIYSPAVLSTC